MTPKAQTFRDAAVELCARQWKSLGVRLAGPEPGDDYAIDPEALVLMTACLGDADPRLRDESSDWCVTHGARLVSTSRLRNVRRLFSETYAPFIDEYFATVNEHTNTRWPASRDVAPRDFSPSGKSALPPPPKKVALLRVQLRSLFGVTARPEVLLALAQPPNLKRGLGVAELTSTGYKKRNVALVLEDLERSGLVEGRRRGNRGEYQLKKIGELQALAPALGQNAHRVRWDLRFAVMAHVLLLADSAADRDAVALGIDALKIRDEFEELWAELAAEPPEVGDPETYADEFLAWSYGALFTRV